MRREKGGLTHIIGKVKEIIREGKEIDQVKKWGRG